eukprot:scaffold1446_cov145-Skeletonema_menzelii.AAC.26
MISIYGISHIIIFALTAVLKSSLVVIVRSDWGEGNGKGRRQGGKSGIHRSFNRPARRIEVTQIKSLLSSSSVEAFQLQPRET